MESAAENLCSVIQYYKGPATNKAEVTLPNSFESQNSVEDNIKVNSIQNNRENVILNTDQVDIHNNEKSENAVDSKLECLEKENANIKDENPVNINDIKSEVTLKSEEGVNESSEESDVSTKKVVKSVKNEPGSESTIKSDLKKVKAEVSEPLKWEDDSSDIKATKCEFETKDKKLELQENENESSIKGKKRTMSEANVDAESVNASNASAEEGEGNDEDPESDIDYDEAGNKPRRRGRCKKNPDIIPPHLSSDMVLGYKILLKFLETPQFSGFHKPFKKSPESENCKITCLNQIKKKFEENLYEKVSDFVNDVREMLINIYESRNQVAIKKALRLEQILEQRIAQLPNYLRPQCALVLSPEEDNNCHNKIRITKGGGFVSLLLEKTEKKRYEKNREKRKLLAEERKQLKEEQDKDVQEWEKNVLLKDFEEDIKSMWELPAIGHFIHLCADILNIGEVAQFEIERMLLMPQCSDTLDLIMTALLTNSLVRAKLDRTPSMPYSIWGPLVRTRVMSWYRMWHRDCRNEQKIFEEIGVEPEFWQILGPDINPLDYYYFHEISLLQRVWILKTLCDVDFVRKKTVYDNIRAQTLDELNPVNLGLDQQGNRYIQFRQFSGSDIRIYRQSTKLEDDITPSELIESIEGFEYREGPITADKVFKDIWELPDKQEVKPKKKKAVKNKRVKTFNAKVKVEPTEKKNLRQSAREKQKTYADLSDSDQSDTDLRTLKNKLKKPETETLYRPFSDKEFISLSVFRLPREKVSKPTPKRSTYVGRRTEEAGRNDGSSGDKSSKTEPEDRKEDGKAPVGEDEQSDSLDSKQMQNNQTDFDKSFPGDDLNEDDFDLREKINNCELDNSDVKFTVKNLENLKMVFKKGANMGEEESSENLTGVLENSKPEESGSTREKEYDALYKYSVPNHLKPDSSKFYLVVDSVEGLRQLISKFGSHENDLEIITRSTKSKRKSHSQNNTSCEVQLIEKLQNLLVELEPWELDLMKSSRSNKEKMYKEYMNFLNRPSDFVHPNESYWMKTYEEPNATTSATTATTTTATVTTAESSTSNGDKSSKEGGTAGEPADVSQQDLTADMLGLRKRTRVTRVQLQPESDDLDEDFDDADDYESNESDDNWVLPTPKKRAKKEPVVKTPKIPRRSTSRRAKSSPFEKTESHASSGEKSQSSSPEKAKKALFWGPRSTDPSEDLNWETNRQKILEQHNSPIKKLLKPDEPANDLSESESSRPKYDTPTQSVIMASPKRLSASIPGNKKPYFSSAQLKAIDTQTKKGETEEVQYKFTGARLNTFKPELKTTGSNTSSDFSAEEGESKSRVQTYSRTKKTGATQSVAVSPQAVSRIVQPTPRLSVATTSSQVVRYGPQICAVTSVADAQQKPLVQIHQSGVRPQKIQIQDLGQNRVITSGANVRVQQPVQWQQKVISVQPGKIVQQQVQTQAAVQNQSQAQVQGQEQLKASAVQQPVQVPAEKLGNILQMVSSQGQTINTDGDLYITDGKNLMKFDNNFVQQLQKDQVVTLDLKKTLLLVKPKPEQIPSTSQGQAPTPVSQQNILVINKPNPVQQTASTTSVPSFVIPANYIIKEATQQAQCEQGQQTVKIVQQSPAYMIQQKPVLSKSMQPQVIKIITSQPMATNQNLILAPVASQVIQPVSHNVVTSEQQTKSTLRFVRPQIASVGCNSAQNKMGPIQSPIIVNNIVQIQGQKLDASKPQTPVVAGRIVSTAVPSVRMATPQAVISSPQPVTQIKSVTTAQSQTQTVLASTNLSPQVIRSNVIAQPVRLTAVAHSQVQTTDTSTNSTPRFMVSTTQAVKMVTTSQCQLQSTTNMNQSVKLASGSPTSTIQVVRPTIVGPQQVRLSTSQPQTVIQTAHPQIVRPTSLNSQTVRVVTQPQILQTQPLVSSASTTTEVAGSENTPTMKIITPQQYQTQTVVPCVSLNSQTVRLATDLDSQQIRFVQSQPVRLIANNSVGVKFINRSPAPVKATVITSGAQSPVVGVSSVRPSGVVCQPVRYQAIVQSPGGRAGETEVELTPTTDSVSANTIANAPIIFVEEEADAQLLEENVAELPVTLDYINGELSVKKTSHGWKYAVKASNGKDIILTDEQIEERLKANNGVMK